MDVFDNINGISPEQAVTLVKSFFHAYCPGSVVLETYSFSGSWGVKHEHHGYIVFLGGDRGGMEETTLIRGDNETKLSRTDADVDKGWLVSEKNILYRLNTIKRFMVSDEPFDG